MMRLKHIIWDWNGTLWDDAWLCVEINNHMLQRRKLPCIGVGTYRDKLCFPVSDYYSQLGFDYQCEPYKRLAEEFIKEYEARRFECALQPGARELIQFFREQTLAQTVLSAYQHDTLLQAIEFFKLTCFFTEIIGLNDIYAAGKAENGKRYMRHLDLKPEEVLFIGDTIHDFEVAEAMGVRSILVSSGHNSRARLESCGVPVFDSLNEIGKHLQEVRI